MSRRPQRARAGNAMIEFALVFGLLWLVLSGCFRLGYSIYIYESALSAVAGAARYAARVEFDEPNHLFAAKVRNMAVYGNPAGGTAPLAPGLQPGHVSVSWVYDAKGVPVTITVSLTGYSVNALFQTFTWSGKPAVTVRYAGSFQS